MSVYLTAEQKDALREIFGKFDNGTGAISAKARTLVVQKAHGATLACVDW